MPMRVQTSDTPVVAGQSRADRGIACHVLTGKMPALSAFSWENALSKK